MSGSLHVALAKIAELGLTEKQTRLALAKLEQIGFIARTTGVEWRRRSGGCQRSPKLWRFAGVGRHVGLHAEEKKGYRLAIQNLDRRRMGGGLCPKRFVRANKAR